jgi:hypothetical protein
MHGADWNYGRGIRSLPFSEVSSPFLLAVIVNFEAVRKIHADLSVA